MHTIQLQRNSKQGIIQTIYRLITPRSWVTSLLKIGKNTYFGWLVIPNNSIEVTLFFLFFFTSSLSFVGSPCSLRARFSPGFQYVVPLSSRKGKGEERHIWHNMHQHAIYMTTWLYTRTHTDIYIYIIIYYVYSGPEIDRNGFQYIFSGDLLFYLFWGLYKVKHAI